MKETAGEGHSNNSLDRSMAATKSNYDRMSSYYDLLSGKVERTYADKAVDRLDIVQGETVLEIGFGTGHSLIKIAEAAGAEGRLYGIDISEGMLIQAHKRIERSGSRERIELTCADARRLPFSDGMLDVVFMSFVLELFSSEDIPIVLGEVGRVLKPRGRLGLLCMSTGEKQTLLLRIYTWLHHKFPHIIDCRPIDAAAYLKNGGFSITFSQRVDLFGLPADIVVGVSTEK
jgi:demethylmenaquinone methyltransferase/2-methoxy-6-polyprenyl-1,4-benzoquinol methylase